MLGLMALAALAAMASVDASLAMAEPTALCLEDTALFDEEGNYVKTDECPKAKRVTHVHNSTLGAKPAILLGVVEIKCDILFLGDVVSEEYLGSPLVISGHFTYTNCHRENGKSCEVLEISETSHIRVLRSAHDLAGVSYEYERNWHCGVLINCTYDGEGLFGHALGPLLSEESSGEVRIEGQVTHRVKGVCPETVELDYLTTPLEAIYITA